MAPPRARAVAPFVQRSPNWLRYAALVNDSRTRSHAMRLDKLIVKNFRSIGPEGITVRFSPDRNIAQLVGANGSGKSNVIQALAIVLGIYPYSRFDVEEEDFFRKDSAESEILIELHLREPVVTRDVYQSVYQIHGFRFRALRRSTGAEKGVLRQEHYCFDSSGKTLVKPSRIYKKSDGGDGIDNTRLPVHAVDYTRELGRFFFIDAQSLRYFFDRTTGWSPLGRLFEIYREDFPGDHNRYSVGEDRDVSARIALEKFSKRLSDILRTAKLKEIEKKLSERVRAYSVGTLETPFKIAFGLPTHREIFEKWVALEVSQHKDIPPLPVESLGSGYQALLRLAVIETLLAFQTDEKPFYLLIEEPETFLHVHLRRYFFGVLQRLADAGNTVIYTTHSPEFVDIAKPHAIVRLKLDADGKSEVHQIREDSSFDFARAKGKVARLGNNDLPFSRHAVLTEGQDDQGIVGELLAMKGVDANVHSISVVNCDGKSNLPDYIRLCHQLAIDYYTIYDEDDPANPKQEKDNQKVTAAVSEAKPSRASTWMFQPDLETTMGERKHCGLPRLLELLDGLNFADAEKKFPSLVKPINEFVTTRKLS